MMCSTENPFTAMERAEARRRVLRRIIASARSASATSAASSLLLSSGCWSPPSALPATPVVASQAATTTEDGQVVSKEALGLPLLSPSSERVGPLEMSSLPPAVPSVTGMRVSKEALPSNSVPPPRDEAATGKESRAGDERELLVTISSTITATVPSLPSPRSLEGATLRLRGTGGIVGTNGCGCGLLGGGMRRQLPEAVEATPCGVVGVRCSNGVGGWEERNEQLLAIPDGDRVKLFLWPPLPSPPHISASSASASSEAKTSSIFSSHLSSSPSLSESDLGHPRPVSSLCTPTSPSCLRQCAAELVLDEGASPPLFGQWGPPGTSCSAFYAVAGPRRLQVFQVSGPTLCHLDAPSRSTPASADARSSPTSASSNMNESASRDYQTYAPVIGSLAQATSAGASNSSRNSATLGPGGQRSGSLALSAVAVSSVSLPKRPIGLLWYPLNVTSTAANTASDANACAAIGNAQRKYRCLLVALDCDGARIFSLAR